MKNSPSRSNRVLDLSADYDLDFIILFSVHLSHFRKGLRTCIWPKVLCLNLPNEIQRFNRKVRCGILNCRRTYGSAAPLIFSEKGLGLKQLLAALILFSMICTANAAESSKKSGRKPASVTAEKSKTKKKKSQKSSGIKKDNQKSTSKKKTVTAKNAKTKKTIRRITSQVAKKTGMAEDLRSIIEDIKTVLLNEAINYQKKLDFINTKSTEITEMLDNSEGNTAEIAELHRFSDLVTALQALDIKDSGFESSSCELAISELQKNKTVGNTTELENLYINPLVGELSDILTRVCKKPN